MAQTEEDSLLVRYSLAHNVRFEALLAEILVISMKVNNISNRPSGTHFGKS